MNRERPTLLIGCGQKGFNWAAQEDRPILCLDQRVDFVKLSLQTLGRQTSYFRPPCFIVGDALSLPLESGSVARIHADFFLNTVFPRGVTFVDVKNNPALLQAPPFPLLVRKWYQENIKLSGKSVNKHLRTIRWLFRATALEQMWEVLARNGKIIIVDKRDVVYWVRENAATILHVDPGNIEFGFPPITPDDHRRSDAKSLELLQRYPDGVKKITLKKVCP